MKINNTCEIVDRDAHKQGRRRYFEYGLDYMANPYADGSKDYLEFERGITQAYRQNPDQEDILREKRERYTS